MLDNIISSVTNNKSINFKQVINTRLHFDNLFFIQIGANDGISWDPIHEFVKFYNWGGILIEPIPHFFEELRFNYREYSNLIFANCAITEKNETRQLTYVTKEDCKNTTLSKVGSGLSSFKFNHKTFGAKTQEDKSLVKLCDVICYDLQTFLLNYNVNKIDFLQIDAEGYDAKILRQLDLKQYKPLIIQFEYNHLEEDEIKEIYDIFSPYYIFYKNGINLVLELK